MPMRSPANVSADRGVQVLALGANADGIERIETDERVITSAQSATLRASGPT